MISAPPAGLGRRLGAMLYDGLLIIALWMCTLFPIVAVNQGSAIQGNWITLLLVAEWAGFYCVFWRMRGQTLGMRAWRLQLVGADGNDVTWRAIARRIVCAPISLFCLGLGYLWLLVDKRGQTWHDRASNTYVVCLPIEAAR